MSIKNKEKSLFLFWKIYVVLFPIALTTAFSIVYCVVIIEKSMDVLMATVYFAIAVSIITFIHFIIFFVIRPKIKNIVIKTYLEKRNFITSFWLFTLFSYFTDQAISKYKKEFSHNE